MNWANKTLSLCLPGSDRTATERLCSHTRTQLDFYPTMLKGTDVAIHPMYFGTSTGSPSGCACTSWVNDRGDDLLV